LNDFYVLLSIRRIKVKRLKMAGLLIVAMSLGLLLVNCGGGSGGDNTGTHGLEAPGDLETLSNDAGMKSQPYYQHLEILPTSYIQNADGTSRQQLKGDANIIYSRYTGDVSPKYSNYNVYKYESTFNLIKIADNSKGKLSSCYLVTELDDGEYSLGICNPDDPNETAWEDTPVLSDFKTYEVGATQNYNSSFERGSFTVLAKEYVTIDNIEYPAWKVLETSNDDTINMEEYRWVNPQYGILKIQTTMTSHEDGSIMFLDGVLREYH
jgi:hypothetical protein